MWNTLLSGDLPRRKILSVMLGVILVLLVLVPLVFPGPKSMSIVAKICVFIVLVASYDLLLGYTGIVSFSHTMFFGLGAYGVAIGSSLSNASWLGIGLGLLIALMLSQVLALLVGLLSLRVKAIFFAMITLAIASAFQTLVSQLSEFTGGEDGLNFPVPRWLKPSFKLLGEPVFGVSIDGRLITYYLIFLSCLLLFLSLLRLVNSPFGRVLQAIRENPFRAEAIGYNLVIYRSASNVFAALYACIAGALYALFLRYNGPDTTLSFEIMLNILLMLVIGGMGTLYGAVIGTSIFIVAQSYLQDGLFILHEWTQTHLSWGSDLFAPERWLLWLGVLFVLSVYYFPKGVVGRLRLPT